MGGACPSNQMTSRCCFAQRAGAFTATLMRLSQGRTSARLAPVGQSLGSLPRSEGEIDGVSWPHGGNIHVVSNHPDRPKNPAVADDLDLRGHYERPASDVEGLVEGILRGSSSLPGRTSKPRSQSGLRAFSGCAGPERGGRRVEPVPADLQSAVNLPQQPNFIEIEPSRPTSWGPATMTPRRPSTAHRRPLPKYGARLAPGLCSFPGGMSWMGCVAPQPFLMRVMAGAVEVAEARAVDLPAGCDPPPQPAAAATTTRAARTLATEVRLGSHGVAANSTSRTRWPGTSP